MTTTELDMTEVDRQSAATLVAALTARPTPPVARVARVESDLDADRSDRFWRTLGKKVRNGSRIRDGYDSHRR